MPDQFGWDNNFGNSPAPSRRRPAPRLVYEAPARPIDSPHATNRRAQIVPEMAAHLVEANAFQNEQDAIKLLSFKGYRIIDIFIYVADARQAAAQSVIAVEMSRP